MARSSARRKGGGPPRLPLAPPVRPPRSLRAAGALRLALRGTPLRRRGGLGRRAPGPSRRRPREARDARGDAARGDLRSRRGAGRARRDASRLLRVPDDLARSLPGPGPGHSGRHAARGHRASRGRLPHCPRGSEPPRTPGPAGRHEPGGGAARGRGAGRARHLRGDAGAVAPLRLERPAGAAEGRQYIQAPRPAHDLPPSRQAQPGGFPGRMSGRGGRPGRFGQGAAGGEAGRPRRGLGLGPSAVGGTAPAGAATPGADP
jgi:hypothetical protein